MMKRLFFFLFISASSVFAQSNIISSFTGAQINQIIHLQFTIIAGQTCNGINIERSTDSLNFFKIGDIAGSCGSTSSPVDYVYTDSFPIHNTNNFYRLAPGNADWSEIIKVYFKAHTANGFIISPNPFHTSAKIGFQYPLKKIIHWRIFNASGKQVSEGSTKEESLTVNRTNLNSGLYFLQLTIDNNILQTVKLIVE